MGRATFSILSRYGLAVLAVAIAILGDTLLDPLIGEDARAVLLCAVVGTSAWYGGVGSGLFSAVLYALAAEFLFPSSRLGLSLGTVAPGRAPRLALLLAEGAAICWFVTFARHAGQRKQADTEERLKAANNHRNEFLAMLSHELRNPLAPVRNAVHILRMAQLDDPALVEARDILDRQVQRIASMIEHLIDISRITNHELVLRKEPVELVELLRQTVEDERSPLEDHRLTVTLELPTTPIWVSGDRLRLSQVLINLLHNAAKFTKAGDRVFVRLRASADGLRAMIRVEDTGTGIPADILLHVFDIFTQAEQSLDRGRGGIGLGLALVKGIVELHGGEVHVESPGPGRGSAFTFWLPLSQQPARGPHNPSSAAPPVKHRQILIVEDNPDAARTLGLLLKRFGYEVATAHSGTSGVQAAKQLHPDIILCDLGLPEMDGYEVATLLRQDPALATARLIAVSGYGCDEDYQRSKAAGFDLHLTKPVDPAELQRLLEAV